MGSDACCEACAREPSSETNGEAPASKPAAVMAPAGFFEPAAVMAPGPLKPTPARLALPVVDMPARGGPGINRSTDRRIAFGGLVVSGTYLALALASLLLPPALRIGAWVPVHLALAGAASTAIAALLPFFAAALVVAPPTRPVVRIGGIGGVALGAIAAIEVYAHLAGQLIPALIAGGTFLVGVGLVAVAAFVPLRSALGPRRPLVERAYGFALVNVAVGVTIATVFVGGNVAVGTAWGLLKPAHAWLNLIGFATLVVVATLVHLALTIAGARIRARASGRVAVLGIAAGAPAVATGYIAGVDLVARAGALAVIVGAGAVAWHGFAVHFDRGRGRWTTDPGWHRMTAGSLVLGQAWIGLGLAIAAARVLTGGAVPAAWSLALLAGPLLIGGVIQVLLGAMTHLIPTIGPGSPQRHATQRGLLGTSASVRLVALNAGAVIVAVAPAVEPGSTTLVAAGLVTVGIAIGASVLLSALAVRSGRPNAGFGYGGPSIPRG